MKFPLRRSIDKRSVTLVIFTLFLIISLLGMNFSELNFLKYFMALMLLSFFTIVCNLINHNHRHHPIFKKNYLNSLFNLILTIVIGAPSTRLHLIHHFNHRFYYPSKEDWSHYEQNAKGKGIKRILTYIFNATVSMSKNRYKIISNKFYTKSLKIEKILFLSFSLIAIIINWKIFAFLIFPGWYIGLCMMLISNLLNHDRCHDITNFNHSRDFLNVFENWFFCNNGYHTAHHVKPHLHWEDLPKFHHETILKVKDSQYISSSFFLYLLQYIIKAK